MRILWLDSKSKKRFEDAAKDDITKIITQTAFQERSQVDTQTKYQESAMDRFHKAKKNYTEAFAKDAIYLNKNALIR